MITLILSVKIKTKVFSKIKFLQKSREIVRSQKMSEKQDAIYQYLEDLQKLTSEIPAELQQRIPNELLSELATSLVEGPIFEIVTSLTEVQNATEKQLFRERLQILRGHSQEKFDFQAKYQVKICDVSDPEQVMKVTEALEEERKEMERQHSKALNEFDRKIVLKLDQQLKDQQSTLGRAGVPGIEETQDLIGIKVQMHLLKCIMHLGKKNNQS